MSTPPAGAPVSAAVPASAGPLTGAPTGAPAGVSSFSSGSSNGGHQPALLARDVAELIAEAVLATPGVLGLHGGPFGTVATYLPGRRVTGVAVRNKTSRSPGEAAPELVEISVVAAAPRGLRTDLQALAARVRAAAAPLTSATVDVTIADLAEPNLSAVAPGALS